MTCPYDIDPTSPDIGFFLSLLPPTVKTKERAWCPKPKLQLGEVDMKKITTLMAILLFTAILNTTVQAATLKCTVDKVEGNVVTMDCGDKAATLKAKMAVKVKTANAKAAAIEGC